MSSGCFALIGMTRNDVHVLVEHHDLRRRLDELLREQSQRHRSRNAAGQTLRRRIVDAAAVVGFEHFLRGPVLIRRAFAPGGAIV